MIISLAGKEFPIMNCYTVGQGYTFQIYPDFIGYTAPQWVHTLGPTNAIHTPRNGEHT